MCVGPGFIGRSSAHWALDTGLKEAPWDKHAPQGKSALDPASRAPHPVVRRKWGGDKTGDSADLFAGAGGIVGLLAWVIRNPGLLDFAPCLQVLMH